MWRKAKFAPASYPTQGLEVRRRGPEARSGRAWLGGVWQQARRLWPHVLLGLVVAGVVRLWLPGHPHLTVAACAGWGAVGGGGAAWCGQHWRLEGAACLPGYLLAAVGALLMLLLLAVAG